MGLEAPCDSWLTLASGLYLSPRTGEALRLGRATLLWMTNSGVDSGLVLHYEKKDSNFDISPLQKLVTKQYKISDRFPIAELILGQCVQEAIPTCEAVSALLRTMSPNHNNCTTIYRTVWSHNTQSWLWNLHEISDGFVKIGYPETFKSNGISSLNHWAHCPSKKNCNVRPFSRFFKPFSEKPIWRPPVLSHFSLVASLAQKMLKFSCFCFSCYGAVAFVKMWFSSLQTVKLPDLAAIL